PGIAGGAQQPRRNQPHEPWQGSRRATTRTKRHGGQAREASVLTPTPTLSYSAAADQWVGLSTVGGFASSTGGGTGGRIPPAVGSAYGTLGRSSTDVRVLLSRFSGPVSPEQARAASTSFVMRSESAPSFSVANCFCWSLDPASLTTSSSFVTNSIT